MKYGVKSLTMDDIARELAISKKTLYLYVVDKDDLVNQAVLMHLNSEEMECNNVFGQSANPIGEMIDLIKWQFKNHGRMNQSALFDLKKYHPESFKEFLAFKDRVIKPRLMANIGKLMFELVKYHLYSVTSNKGRKVLEKELEKFNTELQQILWDVY